MSETKPEQPVEAETYTHEQPYTPPAADPFLSLTKIPVVLTYHATTPPTVIEFPCKLALNDDDVAARQAFYAQPDGDRKAGLYAYQCDFLCRVLNGSPKLPGFEDFQPNETSPVKRLAAYLKENKTQMLEIVVDDAIEMYNRICRPAEFFR